MATNALTVDTTRFRTALDQLKAEAGAITVNSPETCLTAKTTQRGLRNYMKDVHSALDPFVNSAKRNYEEARDQRQAWLTQAEFIDDALAAKVKDFERKEREKAVREEEERNRVKREAEAREAAEQRKAQEAAAAAKRKEDEKTIAEALKAGELKKREAERMKKEAAERERQDRELAKQDEEAAKANFVPDRVAPNIPTVAGVPSRRNYSFRIVDVNKIPRAYLCPDEKKIGQDVRAWKRIGEVIPGVEAFES